MSKFKKLFPTLLILVLALAGASVVYGDASQISYRRLLVKPAVRASQSAADATTWGTTGTTANTAATPIATYGNPKVTALVEWPDAQGGGTCQLACGLYFQNSDATFSFLGLAPVADATGVATIVTLTGAAGAGSDGTPLLCTGGVIWDTKGAPFYDVRVIALSGAHVTVRPWSYGAQSQGQ